MEPSMLHTPLCDILGIRYPIVQAGMGGNAIRGAAAGPELAAAVSEAGGLGVLGGAGASVDEFARAVKQLKALTRKPVGVNLVFPSTGAHEGVSADELRGHIPPDYKQLGRDILRGLNIPEATEKAEPPHVQVRRDVSLKKLEVLLEVRVQVLVYSMGDPGSEVMDAAHQAGMTVMALAGSARQARRLKEEGADIIVAVGYEAGGHSGYVGSMALIPGVVDAVRPLPVLAGGGIADGRGIVAALALGAVGVWVGTRFLASEESGARAWMKELVLRASDTSTTKSKFVSGKPNRHLRSPWDDAWEKAGKSPLDNPYQGLLFWDYLSSVVQAGAYDLSGETMGQGVGLVREIKPAAQIVQDMVAEASQVWKEMGACFPVAKV